MKHLKPPSVQVKAVEKLLVLFREVEDHLQAIHGFEKFKYGVEGCNAGFKYAYKLCRHKRTEHAREQEKKMVIREEVLAEQVLFLRQNVVKEEEEIGTVAQIDC